MEMYRLKTEAVPYFSKEVSTSILSLSDWEKYLVDVNALEEVKPIYVSYGHESLRNNEEYTSKTLCGWNQNNGGVFHFSLHFPSLKLKRYNKFTKDKMIRELMDKIQHQCNYLYQEFEVETKE